MDMQTQVPQAPADGSATRAFVLTHLELYNWGAFSGRHSACIDIEGTAIVGPTGSGKTTLVDALMTLLTANPRYNLASTGGYDSDRDLVSYIRGVSGAGNDSGDEAHIARPAKTVTGICARFSDGEHPLDIGAVFSLDDSSSAAADLKRLWIFSQAPEQSLDGWLEVHHAGGARQLKQLARDTPGLHVSPNKQEYLAHLKRFFEVSENAFALLNRASGLKQLNSIDEIFRELVLDDTSKFERAGQVANEFDDLTTIHEELEVARQQQLALRPIAESWEKRLGLENRLHTQRELRTALPIWYAGHGHRLWGERHAQIVERLGAREQSQQSLNTQIEMADRHAQGLRDIYLQAGGASIEQLNDQLEMQETFVRERKRHAEDYRRLTRCLGLEEALTAEALAANQQRAREEQKVQQGNFERQKQEAWEAGAVQQRHQQDFDRLQNELQQARARPSSNVSESYQQFRIALAAHLDLSEEALPYVAELIEVKPEERHWRGAIERAIGGHRTRIMVPPEAIRSALDWINYRDNHLHVRLVEVKMPTAAPILFEDGYTRKLEYKPHAYREALKQLLAGMDRHCVGSIEQLHTTPHAMTEQGAMSERAGFFEKKDQQALDRGWMTGFDNKALLTGLGQEIKEIEAALKASRAKHEAARQRADATQQTLTLIDALIATDFTTIDLGTAESTLSALQVRLQALRDPHGDTAKAHARWEEANVHLGTLREQERTVFAEVIRLRDDRNHAHLAQESMFHRIGAGLTDAQREVADQHLAPPTVEMLDTWDEQLRNADAAVESRLTTLSSALHACDQTLVRQMAVAKRVDTGALSEAGSEIQDVPTYLERLKQLTEEALPEKLQRFKTYLNQSSDQGVTQLLSDIDNEVSTIEERIGDLNRTLQRVDFHSGHYLRLEPQRVVHASLKDLQQAQRHLRSAALKDDQGESHFRALKQVVQLLRDAAERRKTVGARALLDPRYRLQFAIHVIERPTGAVIEVRTGSQGGSGGEKEIIASYVLTASLSYALCPEGGQRPLFGTIVLDEAFSRSSQAVAGRIISALHEFGLHPLFVTPNKELRLLRAHTRSAILVHRKGQRATITSLSWEELEAHARQRNPQSP